MFPNLRSITVAICASIVALTCGFGLFAAFRVNHEPLGRLAAGASALQLNAGAAPEVTAALAAGESPPPRFGMTAPPIVTAAESVPARQNDSPDSAAAATAADAAANAAEPAPATPYAEVPGVVTAARRDAAPSEPELDPASETTPTGTAATVEAPAQNVSEAPAAVEAPGVADAPAQTAAVVPPVEPQTAPAASPTEAQRELTAPAAIAAVTSDDAVAAPAPPAPAEPAGAAAVATPPGPEPNAQQAAVAPDATAPNAEAEPEESDDGKVTGKAAARKRAARARRIARARAYAQQPYTGVGRTIATAPSPAGAATFAQASLQPAPAVAPRRVVRVHHPRAPAPVAAKSTAVGGPLVSPDGHGDK